VDFDERFGAPGPTARGECSHVADDPIWRRQAIFADAAKNGYYAAAVQGMRKVSGLILAATLMLVPMVAPAEGL